MTIFLSKERIIDWQRILKDRLTSILRCKVPKCSTESGCNRLSSVWRGNYYSPVNQPIDDVTNVSTKIFRPIT